MVAFDPLPGGLGMAGIGASDPLPSGQARVGLLNRQPTLGASDGDYSSCPIALKKLGVVGAGCC